MSALAFASTLIGQRQTLATGRFFERLTERAITGFDAHLGFAHAGATGVFATTLATRPGGWFGLHLDPGRDMPDLAGAGAVTLTLTVTRARPPAAPITRTLVVTGADLAVVEVQRMVDGQALTVQRISAAPFRFEIALDPAPVLLDGLVLRGGDPADPAAGVTVRIAGLPDAVTDAEGRFRIPALPISDSVTLAFDAGGTVTEHDLRPAWGTGAMTATFAIPSP
jgi:hypothetical protein